MALWAGSTAPSAYNVGSTAVSAMYVGSTQVYAAFKIQETWTGANGASWPAQWNTSGNGTMTIQNNAGQMTSTLSTAETYIPSVTLTNYDFTVTVTSSVATASVNVGIGQTWAGDAFIYNGYNFMWTMNDGLHLWVVNGTGDATQAGFAAKTATANTAYKIRGVRNGSSLTMKSWLASGSEPGTWDISVTDSTWTGGFFQLAQYSNGGAIPTTTWDDLTVS